MGFMWLADGLISLNVTVPRGDVVVRICEVTSKIGICPLESPTRATIRTLMMAAGHVPAMRESCVDCFAPAQTMFRHVIGRHTEIPAY
jgi:hypothetical protein